MAEETLYQLADESTASREQHPGEALADETVRWLARLPESVRPNELPLRFPRMANALARQWTHCDACRAYLDDLLINKRDTRQGLPNKVADELATLKNYFETVLYPVPQTVWDEVAGRGRKL